MSNTIQFKRGAVASVPSLAAGEPGFSTDQFRLYVGSAGGNRLMGLLHKINATAAPGLTDDAAAGYSVGSRWMDTTNLKGWVCLSSAVGAANWHQFSGPGVSSGTLLQANNLSDLFNAGIARTNLGVPAGSGNSTGTNTGDQTITLTGDVTGSGTGSFAATIANSAVTNAKRGNMAAGTISGNNGGSAAAPSDLTAGQVAAMLPAFVASGASHAKGLVPDPGSTAGTSNYLREDATWAVPSLSTVSAVGTSTTLNQANDVYQDVTGLTVTLPAAGTYLVCWNLRFTLNNSTAGAYAYAKLVLNGSDVTNSERFGQLNGGAAQTFITASSGAMVVTAVGAHVLKVQAARNGSGTWTLSAIDSNSLGRTTLTAVRIG